MPGASCDTCGWRAAVDSIGIVATTERRSEWSEVPPKFRKRVRAATTLEDLLRYGRKTSSRVKRLYNSRAAALATLPGVRRGDRALVLSNDAVAPIEALAYLGAGVVVADHVEDRLRFAMLAARDHIDAAVHVDITLRLPWEDASFDVIMLDLARLTDRGLPPSGATSLLRELYRLIRPDGSLLMTARNPLSVAVAARDRKSSLKEWVRLLRTFGPRDLRTPWNRTVSGTDWAITDVCPLIPSIDRYTTIVPQAVLRAPSSSGRRIRDRMRDLPQLAHDLALTLSPTQHSPRRRLAADILSTRAVTVTTYSMGVGLDDPKGFVKVPLTAMRGQEIHREVEMTRLAARSSFAPVVLHDVRMAYWNGIPIGIFPHVEQHAMPLEQVEALTAIAIADVTGDLRPLRETELFQMITRRVHADAPQWGLMRALVASVANLGDALVPIGPAHGDLHPGNIVARDQHSVLFVDWETWLSTAPLFIDPLYAALTLHSTERGLSLADAMHEFADGEVHGRLAALAEGRRGALSVSDMLTILAAYHLRDTDVLTRDKKAILRAARDIAKDQGRKSSKPGGGRAQSE